MTKFVLRFASYCFLLCLYAVVLSSLFNYQEITKVQELQAACVSDEHHAVPAGRSLRASGGNSDGEGEEAAIEDILDCSEVVDLRKALSISGSEILLVIWSIGLLVDELEQDRELRSMGSKIGVPFDAALRFSSRSIVFGFALRAAAAFFLSAQDISTTIAVPLYVAFSWFLTINVIFVVFRITQYRSVSKPFGVLIITLEAMMVDIVVFMEVFACVTGGFMLAFKGLTGSHLLHDDVPLWDQDWYGPDSHFMLPMWAMYGEFGELGELAEDLPWASPLLWIYTLTSSVVLVNLLVAMFAETYARVLSDAEQEHRYQKAVRIFMHRHAMHDVPPPFNLPIIALSSLKNLLKRVGKGTRRLKSFLDDKCLAIKKKIGAPDEPKPPPRPLLARASTHSSFSGSRIDELRAEKHEHDHFDYSLGTRVVHPSRGAGEVAELMSDGRTRVVFDSGEEHRYKKDSMYKIKLEGSVATTIAAEKFCALKYLEMRAVHEAESVQARLDEEHCAISHLSENVAEQLHEMHKSEERNVNLEAKLNTLLDKVQALEEKLGGDTNAGIKALTTIARPPVPSGGGAQPPPRTIKPLSSPATPRGSSCESLASSSCLSSCSLTKEPLSSSATPRSIEERLNTSRGAAPPKNFNDFVPLPTSAPAPSTDDEAPGTLPKNLKASLDRKSSIDPADHACRSRCSMYVRSQESTTEFVQEDKPSKPTKGSSLLGRALFSSADKRARGTPGSSGSGSGSSRELRIQREKMRFSGGGSGRFG